MVLVSVSITGFTGVNSAIATTTSITKYTVSATSLNVRKGAGTKYPVIGRIKKGQSLSVKQKLSNGWYKINFSGKTGYVSGSYVKVSTVKSSPSTSTTKPLNVPLIRQRPQLPSGCEVTALAMALSYYGRNVSKTTLANQMPRDRTPLKRNRDGSIKIWGDPEIGFVGDPYGTGFTINPNPLKKVLDKYRKGGMALYGKDFSVIEGYVKKRKPTLVWFTITHELPTKRTWKTPKGKTILAPRPLHCVVVTGVDSKYVYFNDSESTKVSGKNVKVSKSKFIQIYNGMGKRALVVN
ncbi:SH3 domain-containing protein [Terrilactibacillus sp. BCM23-1]|uniref:SH3 domain-containing protein n=2 Tax=Terrilactibacillus TaxID=1795633 RepID=A0A6N8CQX7_9BACI|nr:SH3 domain-containing protein [Terrilactibacillus tamarindi]